MPNDVPCGVTNGMVSIPGAMTPTEVMTAHCASADMIKLFPVSSLDLSYVKAIMAPLSGLRFAAVGGVNLDNIPEYRSPVLSVLATAAILSTKKRWLPGDYATITALAARYVEALNGNE